MKLYGFWRSTATWRVRIALAHKGLAYETVPVDLRAGEGDQNAPGYDAINAMRQVPVLEVLEGEAGHAGPVRLTQSLAILEYLEERWPAPPLLPTDALGRARARQIAEMINAGIQPLQNTGVQRYVAEVMRADEVAWIRHWVGKGMAAVEAVAVTTAGRHAVGDALSFADVCVAPQMYFARRFGIDLDRYPTMQRIEEACSELPAFRQAHAERQPGAPTAPVSS
jgi:maleylpyruvate isomerase